MHFKYDHSLPLTVVLRKILRSIKTKQFMSWQCESVCMYDNQIFGYYSYHSDSLQVQCNSRICLFPDWHLTVSRCVTSCSLYPAKKASTWRQFTWESCVVQNWVWPCQTNCITSISFPECIIYVGIKNLLTPWVLCWHIRMCRGTTCGEICI